MADLFDMVEQMRRTPPGKPSAPREAWRSVDERAMVRGKYTICQYGYKPDEDYGLFGEGPEMLAHDKDYRVLMDKVDELERRPNHERSSEF